MPIYGYNQQVSHCSELFTTGTLSWEWWYIQRMAAEVKEGFSEPYAVSKVSSTKPIASKWLCFQYLTEKTTGTIAFSSSVDESLQCKEWLGKSQVQPAGRSPVPVCCSPVVAKESSCRLGTIFILVMVLSCQKATCRGEIILSEFKLKWSMILLFMHSILSLAQEHCSYGSSSDKGTGTLWAIQ